MSNRADFLFDVALRSRSRKKLPVTDSSNGQANSEPVYLDRSRRFTDGYCPIYGQVGDFRPGIKPGDSSRSTHAATSFRLGLTLAPRVALYLMLMTPGRRAVEPVGSCPTYFLLLAPTAVTCHWAEAPVWRSLHFSLPTNRQVHRSAVGKR